MSFFCVCLALLSTFDDVHHAFSDVFWEMISVPSTLRQKRKTKSMSPEPHIADVIVEVTRKDYCGENPLPPR